MPAPLQHIQSVTVAVILCAGQGTRMSAGQNKVLLPLLGKPMLVYAIEAFRQATLVHEILLMVHPDELAYCQNEIVEAYGLTCVRGVAVGGATRHQSEERALNALRGRIETGEINIVLVHDAARPFVHATDIDRLVQVARADGGAILASGIASDELIVRINETGRIEAVLPSNELWRAQTPQAFEAKTLLAAYDIAHTEGFEGTDTSSTFERTGQAVRIVPGSVDNFKITTPRDLLRAEELARRIFIV